MGEARHGTPHRSVQCMQRKKSPVLSLTQFASITCTRVAKRSALLGQRTHVPEFWTSLSHQKSWETKRIRVAAACCRAVPEISQSAHHARARTLPGLSGECDRRVSHGIIAGCAVAACVRSRRAGPAPGRWRGERGQLAQRRRRQGVRRVLLAHAAAASGRDGRGRWAMLRARPIVHGRARKLVRPGADRRSSVPASRCRRRRQQTTERWRSTSASGHVT